MRLATTIAALAALAVSTPALAGTTITASGRHNRGNAEQSAELFGRSVTLASTCTVAQVTGQDNAGFWIEGDRNLKFPDPAKAVGTALPAGRYWVYPELKKEATTATVSVTFACDT
ncbi:MAG: hypothetical protein KGL44_04390 [Sphingomonadales bacterium]|nr:hypothetical protein [Sphingomonadales bacterium]